jgi:hypothetical protein
MKHEVRIENERSAWSLASERIEGKSALQRMNSLILRCAGNLDENCSPFLVGNE